MGGTSTQPIGVLVIDDNEALCATLEQWLAQNAGIAWVAKQTDWHEAAREARDRTPDIVLLDIDLPGKSGLDLIDPILRAAPKSRVIMLSGLVTRLQIEKALDMGASGYVVKDQEAGKVGELVRRAARGEIVLCTTALAVWLGR